MIDTSHWKEYKVGDIFEIINGKGITTDEISDNPGSFEAVQSGEGNNGVIGYIDKDYCRRMNYSYCEEPCLTVARTGTSGFVSFHENGCVVGDSAKILISKSARAKTTPIYLFLQTLLSANRFKYAYGRKVTEALYKETIIKLPVTASGTPDWAWMESCIRSLHSKPITTKNKPENALHFDTSQWKFFFLKDICEISMGNKLDANAMSTDNSAYNFIGRAADDNGFAMKVDIAYSNTGEEIQPYPAGCITVALGGSLGSSFLQKEPFYTSQNVSVLTFPKNVSDEAKVFICTMIRNECSYKFCPFGRELNAHIRTDFGFKLPTTHEGTPDWQFMENYIKSLPYGDRI